MNELKEQEQPNPNEVYEKLQQIKQAQMKMIEELRAMGDETKRLASIWDQYNNDLKELAEGVGMNTPK